MSETPHVDTPEKQPETMNFNVEFNAEDAMRNLSRDEVFALEFDTHDEAVDWYRKFAKACGFGIRKDEIERGLDGKITSRQVLCAKAGFRLNKNKVRKTEPRQETRCGCTARIKFKLHKGTSKYKVETFDNDHNHTFVDNHETRYIRSNRSYDPASKASLEHFKAAGFRPHQIFNIDVHRAGGHANVGHTKRDTINQSYRDDEEKIKEGDAATALAYLKAKTNLEKSYFLEYTIDNEKTLQRIFWADTMSVADYACFGDLLAFDTTYKKNKYNMPLVIFAGVNHHFRTCIFACAFLQNEKEENYIWALETLTKAMGGKKPKTVITDGDKAMANAIAFTFPGIAHRLCSWHLEKNSRGKVKAEFMDDWFSFLVADYNNDAEFKNRWASLLKKHSVENNRWVEDSLFSKRKSWAHTYLKTDFFAGVKTTSRCEGLNSQLARYVNSSDNLLEFFCNFDRWMAEMREEEIRLDYKSNYGLPETKFHSLESLEKSAADLFSFEAFKKFREELDRSAGCIKVNKEIVGDLHIYTITRCYKDDKSFEAIYDVIESSVECSCYKFRNIGIPCAHMLFVLKEEQIQKIPESFVKHRWSKRPKSAAHFNQPKEMNETQQLALRHGILQNYYMEVQQLAVLSPEAFTVAHDDMKGTRDKLRLMNPDPTNMPKITVPPELKGIQNPPKAQFKGCAGNKGKKRTNKCRTCGNTGHNSRRHETIDGDMDFVPPDGGV